MTDDMDAAAAAIAVGASRPEWLDGCVARQVARISSFREGEASVQPRTTSKEHLERFRDAVVVLKEGLNNPSVMAFMGYNRDGVAVSDRDVEAALSRFSLMSHEALLRIAEKPTVPVAYPMPDQFAVSARMLCAWTVRHTMQLVRGVVAIGPDNPDAHKAANALWRASGGQPYGSRDGEREPSGWRHHFIAAKAADEGGDRRAQWLALELSMLPALTIVLRGEADDHD